MLQTRPLFITNVPIEPHKETCKDKLQ